MAGCNLTEHDTQSGPWNPGIASTLPNELLPFCTIYRPENIFQSLAELKELSEFSGLPKEQLATFRPQRLAIHELLIRVSANFSVPDGDHYEDLGINFRAISQAILDQYLIPETDSIVKLYDQTRLELESDILAELENRLVGSPEVPKKNTPWWKPDFFKNRNVPKQSISASQKHRELLEHWQSEELNADPQRKILLQSLIKVLGSIMTRHGEIRGDIELLVKLISQFACNTMASDRIGEHIEPLIKRGAQELGYTLLPDQTAPVIMNVKGSSAAGKSTLRPHQQTLVKNLGLEWADFALISPDIWRKFLLDYASLGEAYKYAGTCSGEELRVVDQKLDRYMANKARSGKVPHLLIDRFRFDSFAAKSSEEGSNLLTRFGSKVYMFYMITPPHSTVERAWSRGLQVGRFKAVDDLLHHNIEAFNGMPQIFFTWALNSDKDVYYEFLDNSVALGQHPRTVAFGRDGILNILDAEKLLDINRFQKLNINARNPQSVYKLGKDVHPSQLTQFLQSCLERLPEVNFVNSEDGSILAKVQNKRLSYIDPEAIRKQYRQGDLSETLIKVLSNLSGQTDTQPHSDTRIAVDEATLGDWGMKTS